MANFKTIDRLLLQRIRPALQRRLVSTSKKNNDTIAAEVCKTNTNTKVEKNWVSYGFDFNSKTEDRIAMHGVLFTSVTLCMVVGGFLFAYTPDLNLKDWAVREAFLELRRREAAGLPRVDPDFIPAEKIVLPSDEELGDTEIII